MDELTFNLGSKVYFADDGVGSLDKLVFDPDSLEVTDLIVGTGLLLKRSRVVPLTAVSSMSEVGIYLDMTQDDLTRFQEYRETEVERPVDGVEARPAVINMEHTMITAPMVPMVTETVREGVPDDLKIVSPQTAVHSEEGVVGKLYAVRTWADDKKISGIVARQGVLLPEIGNFSIHDIERFGEETVVLKTAP